MDSITWLHISDLHFDASQDYDADIVLKALRVDVRKRMTEAGLCPDFVVVTGDIAFSGDQAEYDQAGRFLDDLLHITGLAKDRLFLVPGNHDVDRIKVTRGAAGIGDSLTDRAGVNAILATADDLRLMLRRFQGYAAFVNEYLGDHCPFDEQNYFYVRRLDLPGAQVAVLGLNSAWVSASDEDEAKRLLVGEYQVREAIRQAEGAGLKIALLHHPFDLLRPFDRTDVEAMLCDKCDFVLHGHMHQVGVLQARTPDSNAFIVAAGACYEAREHPNAYNLVQLDPASGRGAIHLRTYSDRSGGFWTNDTTNYRSVPDGVYRFALRGEPASPQEPEQPAPVPPAGTEAQLAHLPAEKLARARQHYLVQLRRACNALPLAALGGEESADEDVTLDRVYVALNTRTTVPLSEEEKEERKRQREFPRHQGDTRTLTALEVAAGSRRLVLLGDPGGGKSTFVRQLAAWLAAHQLGEAEPPPEGLAGLLPVLVTLRDLVPCLQQLDPSTSSGRDLEALPDRHLRPALARLVRDQVLADLERLGAEDFAGGLDQALVEGGCFLAFDGLDEVPPPLRKMVRQVIHAAIGRYAPPRLVVTCRVRSYTGETTLPKFDVHTLAPFDPEQVGTFVTAWYTTQRDLGRVDAVEARDKAADLQGAALVPELRELSANPMLLTTMAIIHQKEIGLPSERVCLYNLAVDVLLSRWQKRKVGGSDQALVPGLAALLADERKLRQVLECLAYEAHNQGRGKDEAADLTRGQALTLLEAPAYLGDPGLASQFLDYVDRRAGLLLGRGAAEGHPSTYSFPHRTFQEYLAGCHVVGQRYVDRELWKRVREGDYWQLAAQLGGEELLYNRRNDYVLLDVAYRLCPTHPPDEDHTWRAHLWSGQMAALLGRAFVEADCDRPDCGPDYLERLLPRLVRLLEESRLDPHERGAAGQVLARLGDPRFDEDAWCLPARFQGEPEPLLGFVGVPAGPFLMGSSDEKPQHEQGIAHDYWMARYPVTHAQYRVFVRATGHKAPVAEEGYPIERAYEWRDGQPPAHRLNQPVVLVNWHDARAYCSWLTEQLRAWEDTPEPLASLLREQGWQVRLPTEAEWEKAARGTDGRTFPWGNKATPERANYSRTGIDTTSAVGCFPKGSSPYGVLDLSGNVWEWTQSLYRDYPYDAGDGRENPDQDGTRVLRGGAFDNYERSVRCAYRYRDYPFGWFYERGFRVCVAPG